MTSAPYSPEMRGEYSDYRHSNSYDFLREEDPEAYVAQWNWNYNVIAAANVALPYINKVDMPQERRDFYRGEIAFFKAFVYLDLVCRWGDCVMIQDEVELKPIGKTNLAQGDRLRNNFSKGSRAPSPGMERTERIQWSLRNPQGSPMQGSSQRRTGPSMRLESRMQIHGSTARPGL